MAHSPWAVAAKRLLLVSGQREGESCMADVWTQPQGNRRGPVWAGAVGVIRAISFLRIRHSTRRWPGRSDGQVELAPCRIEAVNKTAGSALAPVGIALWPGVPVGAASGIGLRRGRATKAAMRRACTHARTATQ